LALDPTYSDEHLIKGVELLLDGDKKAACKEWNKANGRIAKRKAKLFAKAFCEN